MVPKSNEIEMGHLPVFPVLQETGCTDLQQRGAGFSIGSLSEFQCQECFVVLSFEKILEHESKTRHMFKRINEDKWKQGL